MRLHAKFSLAITALLSTALQYNVMYIYIFSIYLTGGWYFLRNLIGSSISGYPALFTSEQNKMASSYVYVTEEEFFSINEVAVPGNTKKATKFGNKIFKVYIYSKYIYTYDVSIIIYKSHQTSSFNAVKIFKNNQTSLKSFSLESM